MRDRRSNGHAPVGEPRPVGVNLPPGWQPVLPPGMARRPWGLRLPPGITRWLWRPVPIERPVPTNEPVPVPSGEEIIGIAQRPPVLERPPLPNRYAPYYPPPQKFPGTTTGF